jgi:hypothetical protein
VLYCMNKLMETSNPSLHDQLNNCLSFEFIYQTSDVTSQGSPMNQYQSCFVPTLGTWQQNTI